MPSSKRFELCVYLEISDYALDGEAENSPLTPSLQPWDPLIYDRIGNVTRVTKSKIGAQRVWVSEKSDEQCRTLVTTHVRAFDERSYYLCRVLVKNRAFGFINQKYFVFVDLATGEEHELKSETVKTWCKASAKDVGHCYRFRETIYLTRDETSSLAADRAAGVAKAIEK